MTEEAHRGGGMGVIVSLADRLLERKIREATHALSISRTGLGRAIAYERLKYLVKQRSQAQIERMEIRMGLR